MIEPGELIRVCNEHCFPQYVRGFERAIIRPHGRSATSIRRFRVPGQWHTEYAAGFLRISYLTRAQAAQAAYDLAMEEA